MIRNARDRSRGLSLGRISTRAAPTPAALLCATASSSPATSSGEPRRSDQAEQLPARPESSDARSSMSCRAASRRRGFGERLVLHIGQHRGGDLVALSLECTAAPDSGEPHELRRAAGESSVANRTSAASPALSSRAGLFLGQPRASPRRIPSFTAESPPDKRRQQVLSLIGRAAARPVLGHAGGDRDQLGAGGLPAAGGKRLQECSTSFRAAAEVAASGSQTSPLTAPPRSAATSARAASGVAG